MNVYSKMVQEQQTCVRARVRSPSKSQLKCMWEPVRLLSHYNGRVYCIGVADFNYFMHLRDRALQCRAFQQHEINIDRRRNEKFGLRSPIHANPI